MDPPFSAQGGVLEVAPRIGELVANKYEGKVEPRGGGAPYEMYRVVVDREDVGADWDGLDRDEQPPEQPPAAEIAAVVCEHCGYTEPDHAAGCPLETPF